MADVKTRRQEYADLTRQAVLAAATELFAKHGYAATSLEQVAAAARVSKGTVYAHFDGKQPLFKAAFVELERRLHERLSTLVAEHDDVWETCVAVLMAFFDACCDPLYGHVVMREGPVALSYSEFRECADQYSYGMARQLLAALMESGQIVELPLETSSRIAHSMLGSAAIMIADAHGDTQPLVRQQAETVVLALLQGLRVPADP